MSRHVTRSWLAFALLVLFTSRAGFANGAFPAVSQLVVDPADDRHLVLRSNFGLVTTHDGGGTWDWACEDALGYANIEPPIAVLSNGATLLGLPTGIRVADPTACNFTTASGVSANVVDVSAEPASASAALAVSVDYGLASSQVWESTDGGQHWQPLGEPLPQFTALTIDAAKSDPKRIYLSGMDWSGTLGGILRTSSDHGQSWQSHVVPDTDAGKQPYIAALDPTQADTVYVRLTGLPGRLEVTRDAGKQFSIALTLPSPVEGFAVSPDGATLVASSVNDGIFRGSANTLEFERLACEGLSCLSWSSAGLIGCGDETRNGYGLGRSTDEGQSFDVFLDLMCLTGSSECGPNTTAGKTCPSRWPAVASALGQTATSCDPNAHSTPFDSSCLQIAGAPATAGAAGASAPSSQAGAGGESPSAAGGAPAAEPTSSSAGEPSVSSGGTPRPAGGCGCRVTGGNQRGTWQAAGLLLLVFLRRRLRRRASTLTPLLTALFAMGCSSQRAATIDDPYGGVPFPKKAPPFTLPSGDFGITSNNGSDTVTLLDLSSGDALGSAPVGIDPIALDGPHHVALSRQLGAAFVALAYPAPAAAPGPHAAHGSSERPGYVQMLSLTDLAPQAAVAVESNPGDIVLSDDGTRLVVSHFDLLRVTRTTKLEDQRADLALLDPAALDAAPRFVRTCIAPHGVALSRPSGDLAYVACYGEDAIAIVDTSSPSAAPELFSIGPGGRPGQPYYGPYAAILSNDALRLAVSDTESSDVRFFDVESRNFAPSVIVTPGKPYFSAWSKDDQRLFIPTQNPDAILIADPKRGAIVKIRTFTASECQLPHEVVFGSTDTKLFVVCEGDHQSASVVVALDADSLELQTSFPVGVYPDRLAIARGTP